MMTFNIKHAWVLILTISIGLASHMLGVCGVSRACENYVYLNRYAYTTFEPIILYSITLVPLGIALLFATDATFRKWLRFARWWLPLSILIIAITPKGSTGMTLYPDLTKENAAWLMGGLFAIFSIRLVWRAQDTKRAKRD